MLGPSVELPERAVPMAERDLVSGSWVLHRCTPDELLASMAQPFALARSVIVTAAEAWEAGGAMVQSVRARLVHLSEGGDLARRPRNGCLSSDGSTRSSTTCWLIRSASIAPRSRRSARRSIVWSRQPTTPEGS